MLLARQVHTSILPAAPAVWCVMRGLSAVSGKCDGFHPVH
ncbi:putative phage baseplate assembly protein J [Escherichia coli P0304777.9]|nr:putative phage baseplate assembly protein J [Escherichia coli P0304777.11]ENF04872.1 putative phage baseplate assembly protein J [Escherichia coli P0304777.9]